MELFTIYKSYFREHCGEIPSFLTIVDNVFKPTQ